MKTIGKVIQRIADYLVGRFNNAKRAEERDRARHELMARLERLQSLGYIEFVQEKEKPAGLKHRVKTPPKTELEMLLGDEN